MCSKCHKRVAVVFITKIENNETKNEGICLKCAKELGIGPVNEMLEKMGISDLFEFVLDGSYGFPSKPKPDALLFLMEKCNIDPKTAIMIGDRDIDTDAAHNAGIAGCLIEDGYYPDCKTEYYIKTLSELKNIL